MLDIKFVRDNPDAVKENIKKKFQDAKLPLVDEVIEKDAKYRECLKEVESLKAARNKLSKANGPLFGQLKKCDDEAKKAELLKNAETEAKARIAELQQDIRSEQMRLTAAQNATAAYVGKLKELYQHEMDYLNGLSKLSAPAEPVVDQVASAAQDISQSVEKLVAGEAPEEDAEDTVDLGGGAKEKDGGLYAELLELSRSHSPEEAEEPTEPTRRIDFDHLQFGKDYEIK